MEEEISQDELDDLLSSTKDLDLPSTNKNSSLNESSLDSENFKKLEECLIDCMKAQEYAIEIATNIKKVKLKYLSINELNEKEFFFHNMQKTLIILHFITQNLSKQMLFLSLVKKILINSF